MFRVIILLFILSVNAQFNLDVYLENLEIENGWEKCLDILQDNFGETGVIHLIGMNITLKIPQVIVNNMRDLRMFQMRKPEVYVVYTERGRIFDELYEHYTFNPRGKFVIFTPNPNYTYVEKYFLRRSLIIKVDKNSRILQENDCRKAPEAFNIKPRKLEKLDVMWLRKPPYVIDATLNSDPGVEMEVLSIIMSSLKINVTLIETIGASWGSKLNGAYVMALGDFLDRRPDMLIGAFHLWKTGMHLDFDTTDSFMEDEILWVVPNNLEILTFLERLKNIIFRYLWLTLSITLLLLVVIYKLLSRRPMTDVILRFYRPFVENPANEHPDRTVLRVLIMTWTVLVIVTNACLKTQLYYNLSALIYVKPLNSPEDIMKSGLTVGLNLYTRSLVENDEHPAYIHFRDHHFFCRVNYSCLNRTVFQKDMATLGWRRNVEYIVNKYAVDRDGNVLLHFLRNHPLIGIYIRWYFLKGHPHFELINEKLKIVRETGWIDYFYKKMDYNYRRQSELRIKSKQWGTQPLKWNQMWYTFAILFIGYLLAGLTFIVEIIVT